MIKVRIGFKFFDNFLQCKMRSAFDGKPIYTGTDGWKSNSANMVFPCKCKALPVTTCKQFVFIMITALPRWDRLCE